MNSPNSRFTRWIYREQKDQNSSMLYYREAPWLELLAMSSISVQLIDSYSPINATTFPTPLSKRLARTIHLEIILKNIPCDFKFTKFSELHKWIDHDESIAIRGLISHSYPVGDATKPSTAKDYIIVDEERKLVIIRIWGDLIDNEFNPVTVKFPEPTMAVITNVKVTTYHGCLLEPRQVLVFFTIRRCLLESHCLNGTQNSAAVTYMILEVTYKDTDVLLPPPSYDEIIPIPEVANLNDAKHFGTRHAKDAPKQSMEISTGNFHVPRAVLKHQASQGAASGGGSTLSATLFSPDAEKLIHYTAANLKAYDEKNASLTREIKPAIHGKKVLCFLKCLDWTFQGNIVRTYPVLKMYLESEMRNNEDPNEDSLTISELGSSNEIASVAGLSAVGTY